MHRPCCCWTCRSLLLAFFAALPLQYLLVGLRAFDLFTVFVPVYVFLAIPVVSALAGDPERFLERNAKIQWGIMVCVYGLSHAPALLLLDLPQFAGRGAFLLFFLVMVTGAAQIVQELASRKLRRRPTVRQIDRSFSWRAWTLGVAAAALMGAALFWITPVDPWQAMAAAAVAGACGNLGELVMRALKRDAGVRYWATEVRSRARWVCSTAWRLCVLPRRCSFTRCAGTSSDDADAMHNAILLPGMTPC